jgi:hypothetical protein
MSVFQLHRVWDAELRSKHLYKLACASRYDGTLAAKVSP